MPSGGGGDYARWNGFYQSKNTDVLTTAVGPDTAVVPKTTTNHQIWVQKVSWYGEDPLTLEGSDGTALGIINPTVGVNVADFGPQGTPLAVGENLEVSSTAGGFIVHVEAYEKLAVPMAIGPNN